MAYLASNDKLLGENKDQVTDQPQAATTGGPQSISGASSDIVGAGNATGSTTPGQGAWTNIQAYMNANKDDTGSAKALEDKVGTQFNTEKNNFTTDANKVKTEAQANAGLAAEAQKNANEWVNQSGAAYNYAGTQNDAYNQNKSKLQNALTSSYSGPTSYNYALGADTQAAGAALNDNDSFNQYLGNLYGEKAGGTISSGGKALQSQLDVNNENLVNTRQSLADRYKTLVGDRDQTVTDTTKALAQAQSDFTTNQNGLRDYLSNSSSNLDSKIGQLESDAKNEYQNSLKNASGQRAANYDGIVSQIGSGGWNDANSQRQVRDRTNQGIWGQDLSYEQLANEQNILRPQWAKYGPDDSYNQMLDQSNNVLNNFYSQADSKYGNTADAEERQWNFIQDVLGNADRKQNGFKVRG